MTDKPAPKGDTTQARRQRRRRESLNAKAREFGFANYAEMMTAIKNGTAVVKKINQTGP